MTKRKEIPVRNNPGIYRLAHLNKESGLWVDSGKFRAIRRIFINGHSKKEQGVFSSIEDAKAFRSKIIGKPSEGKDVHRLNAEAHEGVITFGKLVEEWKAFHYLQLELSTKQMYDRRLPHLEYLNDVPMEAINTSVIDGLLKYWVAEHPKFYQRLSFEKELNLLKVVLNYYRKRKNPAYLIPVLDEHYKAGDLARRPERPVQALTTEDLGRFLEFLKKGFNQNHYALALAQFSFGLRIGEACGLAWSNLDLEKRVVVIDQVVIWHHTTWEATVKKRPKNNKVRILVIPEVLVKQLEEMKKRRDPKVDLVFHRDGEPYNRKDVGKVYNRALIALGITHVSGTHMMRRTAATLANEATGDFYAVSQLLDHSSPDITLRYIAQTSVQKHKVANALNGVLNSALKLGAENSGPTQK